ncbi:hypothetical protein GCM10025771_09700 [Niveibacterium umoris]|uniref:Uncharacterized protein n=1 Tax=Niveibacterium umoris TaxID=1193620 RepID=A0A840BIW1_9RHOO|nr:hypothetical protein [Niveibacterium umoris]MBB4013481.1 hypothetical protein [Niveibacterium umoris]
MALTLKDQRWIGLTKGRDDQGCGVACIISVLTSLGAAPTDSADQIFKAVQATRLTRHLGATPANIADYLIQQGRTVWYSIDLTHLTPIAGTLSLGLRSSNATKLPHPPAHGAITAGGPPYFIHFLKIKGANPAGHFVVSDGQGSYMDPGAPGYAKIGAFPAWKHFYDTGVTLIVQ